MLSARQQAYLEAMDITVWNLRESTSAEPLATSEPVTLKLGPGSGGILLICAADDESAGRLASDINRVLGGNPVWGWPFGDEDALDLGSAIEENLFTTVAFFGEALARRFFDSGPPVHFKTANVVMLPSMREIQDTAGARKSLWASFCRSGILEQG
ncbi:MAG: hypothetical protein WBS20_11560 [Lysobacterales bacterium]